jgi:DNA repair protein RadC
VTQISIFNVSSVSDTEILNEYVRRFTIPAGESIKTSREAADHFRAYFSDGAKREMFVCCFLNGQHQTLTTEILFEGSLTTSAVYPREVIQRVLTLGAGAVMFAHNHPSSSITPSASDRAVTKKLATALGAIDVEVLDHIVVGGTEYFSFSDHRLL